MSPHEFAATINTFNTAAWHYPPPKPIGVSSVNYYLVCLFTLILFAVVISIHYTHHIVLILVLPFSFLFISMVVIYWKRKQIKKVEKAIDMQYTCNRLTFLTV